MEKMNDFHNINYVKTKLEEYFDISVCNVEPIGSGYDSKAYLVNNKFVFKFAKHKLACKDYKKEKRILDFLNENLRTNIKIPCVEYYTNTNEMAIMGYKIVNGMFLSPKVYQTMKDSQKEKLIQDISAFFKELHCLQTNEIAEFASDNKAGCLEDWEILKSTVYELLEKKEIDFIEDMFSRMFCNDKIFSGRKCLCHNDFSYNHILLDKNYELTGVIDFGDACITDEYCDFLYLLEKCENAIGRDFGLKILKDYGLKDMETALEYADFKQEYYPIETIICGIENDSKELFNKGLKILKEKIK